MPRESMDGQTQSHFHEIFFAECVIAHREGRIKEAQKGYLNILTNQPDHAESLHNLGLLALQEGRLDEAEKLIRSAVTIKPDSAVFLCNLATVLKRRGQLHEAINFYRQAVAIDPEDPDAQSNLGLTLAEVGAEEEAEQVLLRALAQTPGDPRLYTNLGVALAKQERIDKALDCFNTAICLDPEYSVAYRNRGQIYEIMGLQTKAISDYMDAISLDPNNIDALVGLGNIYNASSLHDEAGTAYQKALSLAPTHSGALNGLGILTQHRGFPGKAADLYRKALQSAPNQSEIINNLALTLQDQGLIEDALCTLQSLLSLQLNNPIAHSNLLFCLNHSSSHSSDKVYRAHCEWGMRYSPPANVSSFKTEIPDSICRLRLGFISPDFRRHSVAYFLEPLLTFLDRQRFEVFCYSDVAKPDDVTERLQVLADHWRDTKGKPDAEVESEIRSDRISVMFDLAGHTKGNRLLMFAKRLAPVQTTWLGYPNTTGLPQMDYRLVDELTDPQNGADDLTTEQLIRLNDGFLCYKPPEEAPLPALPPLTGNSHITFGSFNSPAKLSPATFDAWCAILQRVLSARLLLKGRPFADDVTCELFLKRFNDQGIASERITLMSRTTNTEEHLAAYTLIDIALDPFPYNGTTTTCEALWMGVPVVALRGCTHAARVSASLLQRVGLPELIADSIEEYIDLAVNLAANSKLIERYRQTIRTQMAASPLCNGSAFAQNFMQACEDMWNQTRQLSQPAELPLSCENSGVTMTDSFATLQTADSAEAVQAAIAAFPYWYHRIQLPHGIITPGWAPLNADAYRIPERLDGLRVLDVGAWDGYWSFEALRRGAREVIAVDDFSDYLGSLKESDRKAWGTFDCCRNLLGYSETQCQRIDMSVYDVNETRLGRFDVVFFFGTLYHLRHPLLALDKLAAVCDQAIFVESAILDNYSPYRGGLDKGYPDGQMVMEFYPGDQLGNNHTNWWAPTLHCLTHMVAAAGFATCEGWRLTDDPQQLPQCRGFVRGERTSG